MPVEQQRDDQEHKVKVDGTEVKVKTPLPGKVRPVYYCEECDKSFPSQLDLEEHRNVDHSKK
jgi:hypothetical protein